MTQFRKLSRAQLYVVSLESVSSTKLIVFLNDIIHRNFINLSNLSSKSHKTSISRNNLIHATKKTLFFFILKSLATDSRKFQLLGDVCFKRFRKIDKGRISFVDEVFNFCFVFRFELKSSFFRQNLSIIEAKLFRRKSLCSLSENSIKLSVNWSWKF